MSERTNPEAKRQGDRRRQASYRERNRELINQKTRNRRRGMQAQILDFKSKPCQDCEGRFPPVAMDFDHVRGDKIASVAVMVSDGWSLRHILAEIAKCDLVCANCHRIRTATRSGWDESLTIGVSNGH